MTFEFDKENIEDKRSIKNKENTKAIIPAGDINFSLIAK